MRIINIIENLNKGAVENWIVQTFIESKRFQPSWHWTFYCILGEKGQLDEIVCEAGGEIVYAPVTISYKILFLRHLRHTLKVGHYDIIHSHHDYLSGFYLLASIGISFKKRILHIHNTDKIIPVGNKWLRKILLVPLKSLAFYLSDIIVGISKDTLFEFAGNTQSKKIQFRVLYYGVNLNIYNTPIDKQSLIKELKLPPFCKILLFVGRMNELKNPVFVVEILAEILRVREDVYALFVGKGDLEKDVIRKANHLHICNHIRMLGWRNDTISIFKSADVFVFPRVEYPKEGLGLVVIEAQAAGLPMVISQGIVDDAIIINQLATILALKNGPQFWATKIVEILGQTPADASDQVLYQMRQSPFELETATKNFLALYKN